MTRDPYPALPLPPAKALWLVLRAFWRERRCGHFNWEPLEGPCPDCGGNW